jgi:BON domain
VEKDYEDTRDIEHLTDNELRALVRDEFDTQLAFDPDDVEVSVSSGAVKLSGRVGTEEELRIVERLTTDLVGIERMKSELVVDPIRRAESPEAIDEHLVDEELHGDRPRSDDPEAEHLREDLPAELFGTTDIQQAIEGAIPWNPPDGPTPEGLEGSEDQRTDARDDM